MTLWALHTREQLHGTHPFNQQKSNENKWQLQNEKQLANYRVMNECGTLLETITDEIMSFNTRNK